MAKKLLSARFGSFKPLAIPLVVMLIAAFIFFGVSGLRFPWLPEIPLTYSEFLGKRDPIPPDFLPGQDDLARRMYEAASIASYGAVVTLTLLSLTIPLLLLYFAQIIDGLQSVLQAVFEEIRPYRENNCEVPKELQKLATDCSNKLKETSKIAKSLQGVFITVFIIAIGLLIFLLIYNQFAVRSIFLYAVTIRAFNTSIFLSIVSILVLGYIVFKGRSSRERIDLLNRLTVYVLPVPAKPGVIEEEGKGIESKQKGRASE